MQLSYKEYRPSEELSAYVHCYWSIQAKGFSGKSDTQRCFPAGLVEFIVNVHETTCEGFVDNVWKEYPSAVITGMYSKAALWRVSGNSELFGIRFTPEGAMRLFGQPVNTLINSYLDAESYGGVFIKHLVQVIRDTDTIPQRLFWLEKMLHEYSRKKPLSPDYFSTALRMIRMNDSLRIEDLSRQVSVGERQLQRTFKSSLGISPKTYYKLMRLYKAHHRGLLKKGNLGNLALDLGYTDLPHFNKDFKTYFGISPSNYFTNSSLKLWKE